MDQFLHYLRTFVTVYLLLGCVFSALAHNEIVRNTLRKSERFPLASTFVAHILFAFVWFILLILWIVRSIRWWRYRKNLNSKT